jgi:hypothetical protein
VSSQPGNTAFKLVLPRADSEPALDGPPAATAVEEIAR